MAVTLHQHWQIQRVTLGASNEATKVVCPEFTRFVWIQFQHVPGKFTYSGTDGALIGNNIIVLHPDEGVELQQRGDLPFFLASDTEGAEVSICAVDR